ncbi:hypothetical protein L7F22_003040 [Adiantum nelumboides]|nr:hypothetical protein [Adiantum nelumboides]
MGIAILSGVLDSKKIIEARRAASAALSQSRSNGSTTPISNGTGSSFQQQQDLSASIASLLELEDGDDATTQNATQLPTKFLACVNRQESARKLKKTFEDHESVEVICKDNLRAAREADAVIIACKPQMVADILQQEGIKDALRNKLLCSICAGLTIKGIQAHVDKETTVVRAMPNTPSKIREGMTILTPLPATIEGASESRNRLVAIFSAVGKCRILDEKHFDAATALAGSGPAFACVFLEAMVDGAVMMGMPRSEALELAAQTMQGAARMVLQSGMHPAAIKDSVTTPGGCTIAGLMNLEDGRLRSTVARTIQAATEHAAGLGKPKN